MRELQDEPQADQALASAAPARKAPSLAILVAISTLQPFALNVLAPATPILAQVLQTDYATIQLTLTVYLATVAVTQLFVGPISDRIGRRPCILGGVALFLIGSAMGAFAETIEGLLVARVIQATGGGTCFALARAVVRDTSGKERAASLIGYLSMAMVISPMIAPFIGGVLEETFGWRSIFAAMALLASGVLVAAWFLLYETAPPQRLGLLDAGSPARFSCADRQPGLSVSHPDTGFRLRRLLQLHCRGALCRGLGDGSFTAGLRAVFHHQRSRLHVRQFPYGPVRPALGADAADRFRNLAVHPVDGRGVVFSRSSAPGPLSPSSSH